MPAPYLGHCLCGQVRFRLNVEPLTLYACHCTDCQRRSGGACLLSMWVQRDSLEVLAGNPELVTSIAPDGRERRNRTCPACEVRLWAEPVHRPGLAILRPGTLAQAGEFTPIAHQFVRSALPWFVFPEGVARYETSPEDPSDLVRLWRESRHREAGQGESRPVRTGDTTRAACRPEPPGVPMKITVSTLVMAPIHEVWRAYTTADDIKLWNTASPDWHTTAASVDLRPGGKFSSRMEARDGSFGFDFAGEYTRVVPHRLIEYSFGDRVGLVTFDDVPGGVSVTVAFDSEPSHPQEQQRTGWQAILDSFSRHVAGKLASQ